MGNITAAQILVCILSVRYSALGNDVYIMNCNIIKSSKDGLLFLALRRIMWKYISFDRSCISGIISTETFVQVLFCQESYVVSPSRSNKNFIFHLLKNEALRQLIDSVLWSSEKWFSVENYDPFLSSCL